MKLFLIEDGEQHYVGAPSEEEAKNYHLELDDSIIIESCEEVPEDKWDDIIIGNPDKCDESEPDSYTAREIMEGLKTTHIIGSTAG